MCVCVCFKYKRTSCVNVSSELGHKPRYLGRKVGTQDNCSYRHEESMVVNNCATYISVAVVVTALV